MENTADILFIIDTTGSMIPAKNQVEIEGEKMIKRLIADVPGSRVGIIFQGDYCDAGSTYVTKSLDFTSDLDTILRFVRTTGRTGGGDSPECYEFSLHEARTKMSWRLGINRALVLIADDIPHPPSYHLNKLKLDWKKEAELLAKDNVHIFAVHALSSCRQHASHFYEELARITKGFKIDMEQFADLHHILMAICYKQAGDEKLKEFEENLIKITRTSREVRNAFNVMLGRPVESPPPRPRYDVSATKTGRLPKPGAPSPTEYADSELVAVPRARFQVLPVTETVVMRDFLDRCGIDFKPGLGFYRLEKTEEIQEYKEVILRHKVTGDFFGGDAARRMIGLPPRNPLIKRGGTNTFLKPVILEDFEVYVQSTSPGNRSLKVKPGQTSYLLYELPDWKREASAA